MEAAVAYSVVLCHHLQPVTQQHHEKPLGGRQIEHSKRPPDAMSTQIPRQRTSAGSCRLVKQERLFEECVNEGWVPGGWGCSLSKLVPCKEADMQRLFYLLARMFCARPVSHNALSFILPVQLST
jgi:hypothetical protein